MTIPKSRHVLIEKTSPLAILSDFCYGLNVKMHDVYKGQNIVISLKNENGNLLFEYDKMLGRKANFFFSPIALRPLYFIGLKESEVVELFPIIAKKHFGLRREDTLFWHSPEIAPQ